MKKGIVFLFSLILSAGIVCAQNDDEIQKKQQQQRYNLQEQQKKEQEHLQRQQQKEESRLAKEQARERQEAAKKEQDRIMREQIREQNAVRKEQEKAEQKAKHQRNFAKWGRRPQITADPYVSILTDRRFYGTNNRFNAVGFNVGGIIDWHLPVARRWDISIGAGYRYTNYFYSHLNGAADDFDGREETRFYNTVVVPFKVSYVSKDNKRGWYLGVAPGVSFGFDALPGNAQFNAFRCDISLGTQSRWLIFAPGIEAYINLVPTYTTIDANEHLIHEFGIRFSL